MAQALPGTNYTVQQGDSLSSIAQQAYGDGNLWQIIYQANTNVIGSDPNQLQPGMILSIPVNPGPTYIVHQGDSLFSIAQQVYGDGNQWQKIYQANRQIIGSDPNQLQPGMILSIPPLTPPTLKTCTVTAATGLNIRAAATSQSALISHYPAGTTLNFVEVVNGENVAGNSHWGHSQQGHYFWLGGTDHPNG